MAQLERLIRIIKETDPKIKKDSFNPKPSNRDFSDSELNFFVSEAEKIDTTGSTKHTKSRRLFKLPQILQIFTIRRWPLIGLVLFLVLTSAYLYRYHYLALPQTVISIKPSPISQGKMLMVHVVGEVNKPGLVQLPPGSRIDDALKSAGGFTKEADIASQNLAQLVTDGMQIRILKKGISQDNAGSRRGKISINQADVKTLETLSGVGPVMAEKIVEYRKHNGPFTQIKDLTKVKGFGKKLFTKIEDQITI